MQGFYAVRPDSRVQIAPKFIFLHSMIVDFRLLNRLIQHHAAYSLHNHAQISSRMVIQILVKISHTTMELVVSLASDGIILVLDPQLCFT